MIGARSYDHKNLSGSCETTMKTVHSKTFLNKSETSLMFSRRLPVSAAIAAARAARCASSRMAALTRSATDSRSRSPTSRCSGDSAGNSYATSAKTDSTSRSYAGDTRRSGANTCQVPRNAYAGSGACIDGSFSCEGLKRTSLAGIGAPSAFVRLFPDTWHDQSELLASAVTCHGR